MSEVEATRPRPRMISLWRVISLLLLVAVFYFVGKQLGRDFKELKAQQIHVQVNWIYLAAGLVCLMGARLSNAVNSWLLLRAMGVPLPMWRKWLTPTHTHPSRPTISHHRRSTTPTPATTP